MNPYNAKAEVNIEVKGHVLTNFNSLRNRVIQIARSKCPLIIEEVKRIPLIYLSEQIVPLTIEDRSPEMNKERTLFLGKYLVKNRGLYVQLNWAESLQLGMDTLFPTNPYSKANWLLVAQFTENGDFNALEHKINAYYEKHAKKTIFNLTFSNRNLSYTDPNYTFTLHSFGSWYLWSSQIFTNYTNTLTKSFFTLSKDLRAKFLADNHMAEAYSAILSRARHDRAPIARALTAEDMYDGPPATAPKVIVETVSELDLNQAASEIQQMSTASAHSANVNVHQQQQRLMVEQQSQQQPPPVWKPQTTTLGDYLPKDQFPPLTTKQTKQQQPQQQPLQQPQQQLGQQPQPVLKPPQPDQQPPNTSEQHQAQQHQPQPPSQQQQQSQQQQLQPEPAKQVAAKTPTTEAEQTNAAFDTANETGLASGLTSTPIRKTDNQARTLFNPTNSPVVPMPPHNMSTIQTPQMFPPASHPQLVQTGFPMTTTMQGPPTTMALHHMTAPIMLPPHLQHQHQQEMSHIVEATRMLLGHNPPIQPHPQSVLSTPMQQPQQHQQTMIPPQQQQQQLPQPQMVDTELTDVNDYDEVDFNNSTEVNFANNINNTVVSPQQPQTSAGATTTTAASNRATTTFGRGRRNQLNRTIN